MFNYDKFAIIHDYKNSDVTIYGTSLAGSVSLSPKKLIEVFGEPSNSDEYKISGQYVFVHVDTGIPFTVYDWKSTSLYDGDLISPSTLWSSNSEEFHIGTSKAGRQYVDDFIKELLKIATPEVCAVPIAGTYFMGGLL